MDGHEDGVCAAGSGFCSEGRTRLVPSQRQVWTPGVGAKPPPTGGEGVPKMQPATTPALRFLSDEPGRRASRRPRLRRRQAVGRLCGTRSAWCLSTPYFSAPLTPKGEPVCSGLSSLCVNSTSPHTVHLYNQTCSQAARRSPRSQAEQDLGQQGPAGHQNAPDRITSQALARRCSDSAPLASPSLTCLPGIRAGES